MFLVNVNAGQMDLTVTPAWDAYTDNTARGQTWTFRQDCSMKTARFSR